MAKTNNKQAIREEVSRFLETNITAVVATINDEAPNNSIVYYTSDQNNNIYFETPETTNKCQNLRKTPLTALVIAGADYLISAQIKGHAVELSGDEKKQVRKELLQKRLDFQVKKWPPHDLMEFKNKNMSTKKVTFKIVPCELLFFNLGERSYPTSLSSTSGHIIINKNDNKE